MRGLEARVIQVGCIACLVACGGGNGGGGNSSNSGSQSPEGIYFGTIASSSRNLAAYAAITPQGEVRYVASNNGVFVGQFPTLSGYVYFYPSYKYSVAFSNLSIAQGSSVSGRYSAPQMNDSGSFTLTYNNLYLRPKPISVLAGLFTATESYTTSGYPVSLICDPSGNITGSDQSGSFTGKITLNDSSKNLYAISLQYSYGNTYSGLGFWSDVTSSGLYANSFYVQVSGTNNNQAMGAILTRHDPTPLAIVTQPSDLTIGQGGNAVFSVAANGTGHLYYQWYRNGQQIPNETKASLTLPKVTSSDNNSQFNLVITDDFGATKASNTVLLTVTMGALTDGPPTLNTRTSHLSQTLIDGRILLLGGEISLYVYQHAVDIFDPVQNAFSTMGTDPFNMIISSSSDLLNSGKVILLGGQQPSYPQAYSRSALFDPSNNSWSYPGAMNYARWGHQTTLMKNGNLLISGGCNGAAGNTFLELSACEVFDATTNKFSKTGSMSVQRIGHSSTLLPDGKVLIAGGSNVGTLYNQCEIYDPTTGSFSPTGNLKAGRSQHAAFLRNDGKVIVLGGIYNTSTILSCEIYDPFTGTFTLCQPMPLSLNYGDKLKNGKHLFFDSKSTYVFDPNAITWRASGYFLHPNSGYTANLLPSGKVIFIGGKYSEIYDPQE